MGLPGVDTLRVGVPGPPGHRHISRLQPPRRGEDHIGVGRSERSDLGLEKHEVPSGYHSIGLGYQPSIGQQVRHPIYFLTRFVGNVIDNPGPQSGGWNGNVLPHVFLNRNSPSMRARLVVYNIRGLICISRKVMCS